MTAPRLEACYFPGPDQRGKWDRLARTLEHTAREQCRGWAVRVAAIQPGAVMAGSLARTLLANTCKLAYWSALVRASQDGDRLLLIDADTMVLRDLADVWQLPFDLAYTSKPGARRLPINGGVVFLRVSDRVRAFMAAWQTENDRMLEDRAHHERWKYRFGGINQAAFGCLLTTGGLDGLDVRELACQEWNCEDSTWESFDDCTRILHIKGELRMACFHPFTQRAALKPLADRWRAAEARARTAMECTA